MTTATESTQSRRIGLILRQVDSLPTLPAIATRLLTLTANEDTNAREVIQLVSSDPTLTAKVLSMCRKSDRGLRDSTMTINKAVVLLGFNAIRNAALSIKVFEVFNTPNTGSKNLISGECSDDGQPGLKYQFEREDFWRHSLAVGIACELIAAAHPHRSDLPSSEAFVCGLMHDVGKLALDYVLPKSYARVVEMAEVNHGNISDYERRVMGVDHQTAGKRLSEQWMLPYWIQDCIWLHGSEYATLPKLAHRRMIGLVGLADLVVRRSHIGYSGNFAIDRDPAALALELGLNPNVVDSISHRLHEELQERSEVLGLNDQPSRELFMESIQQANQVLGRLNTALERRNKTAERQLRTLGAITSFHEDAKPGQTVQDVMDSVIGSAVTLLGAGTYVMLYKLAEIDSEHSQEWLLCLYSQEGHLKDSRYIEPPQYSPDLAQLTIDPSAQMSLMGVLPWLGEHLEEVQNSHKLRLLTLGSGWGTVAVMLHDLESLPPANQLQALTSSWGAAIAGAAQHEGARRLGEDLAQANRDLANANHTLHDIQEKLLHAETLARLGEMAAGAAHEMNNPLAVISGRGQLLATGLAPGSKEQTAAMTIVEQSQRLSDLISSMRMFSDPPQPELQVMDVTVLLDAVVKEVNNQLPRPGNKKPISLQFKSPLPPVSLDPEQIGQTVTDLVMNAVQSQPKTAVHVTVYHDQRANNLVIQVIDDGKGMDAHTLAHATDPFFSSKMAGRQMGMGLTRAELYVKGHRGALGLSSTLHTGTVATVTLPLDSAD
jgi:signal transduction histidine kinase/HD-like signal output (HDOD) protein